MSTETKWTPGPWKIDEYGRVTADASGCALNAVGVTGFCLTTSDEAAANTRLAAAAPELFEALDDLLSELDSTPEIDLSSWGVSTAKARAARAKARGAQHD